MMNRKSQKGQAIILLAFAIVGLVGFAALAIDGGRALSDKRHAQNAADNSAFAAALAIVKGQDYETAALNRAATNDYTNGTNPNGSTSTVTVILCDEVDGTPDACQGLPAGADPTEYVRVRIVSTFNTSFARVIGRPTVTSRVEAIAHASGVTVDPLIMSAALAAFKRTGTPFDGGGNNNLNVYGSGVFSNSTDTDCPNGSMSLGGNVTYHVDTSFASAGKVCENGKPKLEGTITNVGQVNPPKFDITPPNINCGSAPALPNPRPLNGELVYQPGNYNSDPKVPPHGNIRFAPGDYCFSTNLSLTGGTYTLENVNIRMNSAKFSIGASTTVVNCSNVVIHTVGSSADISVTGGTTTCNGITFYAEGGGMTMNGGSSSVFRAPTTGDYKGLLIYMPDTNDSTIKITGNSNNEYTGSIFALASEVTIDGNNKSAGYNVQVLADTIKLTGNADINIHFNPDNLYNPPQQPTVELTK